MRLFSELFLSKPSQVLPDTKHFASIENSVGFLAVSGLPKTFFEKTFQEMIWKLRFLILSIFQRFSIEQYRFASSKGNL